MKKRGILKYLKETRKYILVITILFLATALIGYFFPVFFENEILKFIEELAKQTQNYNLTQLLFFILQNNLKSSFTSLIFGAGFGIVPIISTIFNGYVLGFVSNLAVESAGFSSLLSLLPHGIFEIPAIILSLSLGLKLGIEIITKKPRKKQFIYNLEKSLWAFIYIIIPLLIIAAIIEAVFIALR